MKQILWAIQAKIFWWLVRYRVLSYKESYMPEYKLFGWKWTPLSDERTRKLDFINSLYYVLVNIMALEKQDNLVKNYLSSLGQEDPQNERD